MWVLSSVSGPGAGREMGKWPVEDFYITLEIYSLALCRKTLLENLARIFCLGTNINHSTAFFTTISNSSKFVIT